MNERRPFHAEGAPVCRHYRMTAEPRQIQYGVTP
jgi:hypothetical protein